MGLPRPHAARHLYIHIPFCHRRCAYCDFNTYANMDDRMGAYVDALCRELAGWRMPAAAAGLAPGPGLTRAALRPTIFLGGGTPSMLPLALIERVLAAAYALIPLDAAEVTVEANPGTVLGRDYLRGLRALGVNRLSMGVQSLHDPTLRVLGRIHTAAEARASFDDARRAGFDSINLDFMFGLPGQTVEQWEATLREIASWGADHFSLYSLILEEKTPLYAQVMGGRLHVPDQDAAGEMYELAIERLDAAGYAQYEISNWARRDRETGRPGDWETGRLGDQETGRPGDRETGRLGDWETGRPGDRETGRPGDRETNDHDLLVAPSACLPVPAFACHHNLAYWLNADYLATGAGAHGHLYPQRFANVLGIDDYIGRVVAGRTPIAEVTELSARDLAAETMFMGLRLNAGVSFAHFQERCGGDLGQVYANELRELIGLGLLERDALGVRLTPRGRMLGNQVFERFV